MFGNDDNNQTSQTSNQDDNQAVDGLGTPPPVASDPITTDDSSTALDSSAMPQENIITPPAETTAPNEPSTLPDLVSPSSTPEISTPGMSSADDLSEIKGKALKELTPLVTQLDQPPLEKFKTLMMTIQAGDNKELIGAAYDAAEKIEDVNEKAQALLDIINEINYFSQTKA